MSKLHVRHIKEALVRDFGGHVDVSDYASASETQREKVFLTRALAALAVQRFTQLGAAIAGNTVVDGSNDNGIDAIYLDRVGSRIILVQSKWDINGTGTIGLGDARNFVAGFKDLTDERFDRFNNKIRSQQEEISDALGDVGVKFLLVVASTGISTLAPEVQAVFDDVADELNAALPLVSFEYLGLKEFHSLIAEGLHGAAIDIDAGLENWGSITEPYEAFYGVVDAETVGKWYENHGDRLFGHNIRNPLGNTEVNNYLKETLLSQAADFWYFNNGVTVLCEKIERSARGAATRVFGQFKLIGASVVNGAQTVASIHKSLRADPEHVKGARVWVRFISLEGCPPDFAKAVTRATNTQNSVEARDFVALDPEQGRLRTEMLLSLEKTYSIKRGDQTPPPSTGCTVIEATTALACAHRDPGLAVLAKSAIGRLWDSTDRPPYKLLFNSALSVHRLWRSVLVLRRVELTLGLLRLSRQGRERAVIVQGNRIVTHLVFRLLDLSNFDDPDANWGNMAEDVTDLTNDVVGLLTHRVEELYANNYITSLFKNASRCRDLVELVREDLESEGHELD